jgi:hypothetical protein
MSNRVWTFTVKADTFVVDPQAAFIEKNGLRVDTKGLTDRHFKALALLLEHAPKPVRSEDLAGDLGTGQPLYDIVRALRDKLGRDTIQVKHLVGYFIPVHAHTGSTEEPDARMHLDRLREPVTPFFDSNPQRNLRLIAGFLGGEGRICAAVSLGFGTMMGVSLPMEVAYRWPDFENWVVRASLVIGASSAAVAVMTFEWVRRRATAGRCDTLGRAAGVLSVWSLAIAFLVATWLPNKPILMAHIQTMTAKVGWGKSVLEALGLPILALIPVQAVFALRYLISSGHEEVARDILGRNRALAGVLGGFVPGAWPSFAAFVVVIWWRIRTDGHLVENLKDGPYYALFLSLLVTRSGVGCIMLLTVLMWYLLRLNRFEHEVRRRD